MGIIVQHVAQRIELEAAAGLHHQVLPAGEGEAEFLPVAEVIQAHLVLAVADDELSLGKIPHAGAGVEVHAYGETVDVLHRELGLEADPGTRAHRVAGKPVGVHSEAYQCGHVFVQIRPEADADLVGRRFLAVDDQGIGLRVASEFIGDQVEIPGSVDGIENHVHVRLGHDPPVSGRHHPVQGHYPVDLVLLYAVQFYSVDQDRGLVEIDGLAGLRTGSPCPCHPGLHAVEIFLVGNHGGVSPLHYRENALGIEGKQGVAVQVGLDVDVG